MENDFMSADEISKVCNIAVEDILECVDKGLTYSYKVAKRYFPEQSLTVKKIMILNELNKYGIDQNKKSELINRLSSTDDESDSFKNVVLREIS